MQAWTVWAAMAGALVILELFTGTFYLLMIALGLLAGMLAAWMGAALSVQLVSAAVVGAVATGALHRSRFAHAAKGDSARNRDVNLDIGEALAVPHWHTAPDGRCTARVHYRGAQWDVELAPGLPCVPGQHTIAEVRGNRLIVAPA
ncbi:MAG TPA: NfeD family protein [Pseudoxanthomonas sp.]